MRRKTGTEGTRTFYNETGWKEQDGASVDHHLFGVKEDGPIRVDLNRLHNDRIRTALSKAGTRLNLLECGCGGHPAKLVLDLCEKYTGVDFSDTGLEMARSCFANVGIAHQFQIADVCALPFEDGVFDAVYSAHMIYHIEDPAAQDAAIHELMRVTKVGGVVVLVAANPRPLAFPMQLLRRLVADTPLVGSILNGLRSKPPVPYNPMLIGWMRRRLAGSGPVEVLGCSMPSTSFYQNVTEFKGTGKLRWKAIRWLDVNFPKLSAYLGNYVLLSCSKVAG
jgi:2-polyprenyl-3-methyl-5-hydroxy-6-metoxy-1,4-benzoquinol methylase